MDITVNTYLNVREGKPSLNAPCKTYLAPGSEIEVDGKLYKGDLYDGNDNWMKDAGNNYYWAGGLDLPAVLADNANTSSPVTPVVKPVAADTPVNADINNNVPVPPVISADSNASVNYNTMIAGIPDSARTSLGEGVTIAIIDTGCVTTYPDLQSRIIARYDSYDKTPDANDISANSHGTFIAGLLCADGAIRGIAPAVKLIIVKVLRSLSVDNVSAVNDGLLWLLKNHRNVDIVSMSMDFEPVTYYENLLKITFSQFPSTTMFVAAAGDNTALLGLQGNYPARYPAFTGVGAISAEQLGNGSLNDTVRYIFPDVEYTSYLKTGSSGKDKGSSYATAITSGLMALHIADYKKRKVPYDKTTLQQDIDRLAGSVDSDDFRNDVFKPYRKPNPIA